MPKISLATGNPSPNRPARSESRRLSLPKKKFRQLRQIHRNIIFQKIKWGDRVAKIFQRSRSHLKLIDARRMTGGKFHTEDPEILCANAQSLGARANWHAAFVHPWRGATHAPCTNCKIILEKETINILRYELCRESKNIFGSCEACWDGASRHPRLSYEMWLGWKAVEMRTLKSQFPSRSHKTGRVEKEHGRKYIIYRCDPRWEIRN